MFIYHLIDHYLFEALLLALLAIFTRRGGRFRYIAKVFIRFIFFRNTHSLTTTGHGVDSQDMGMGSENAWAVLFEGSEERFIMHACFATGFALFEIPEI